MKVKYPKVKWYGNRAVIKHSDGHYYYRGFDITRNDACGFDAKYIGKTFKKPKYHSAWRSSVSKLVDEIDYLYRVVDDEFARERARIRFHWFSTTT